MKFPSWLRQFTSSAATGIAKVAKAFAAPIGFREVLLFGGVGLLALGAWEVHPAAGLALPGAVLIYVSVFGTP